MMRISSIFYLTLVLLFTCQCEKNSQDSDKEKKLNEKIAGSYKGLFTCVSYTGNSYPISNNEGRLSLEAVGTDSLLINFSDQCIYSNSYFAYDAASSTSTTNAWKGNSPYSSIKVRNDSVFVSVPRPCSCGWLGSDFKGKKQ
jgi:hypothetical protein